MGIWDYKVLGWYWEDCRMKAFWYHSNKCQYFRGYIQGINARYHSNNNANIWQVGPTIAGQGWVPRKLPLEILKWVPPLIPLEILRWVPGASPLEMLKWVPRSLPLEILWWVPPVLPLEILEWAPWCSPWKYSRQWPSLKVFPCALFPRAVQWKKLENSISNGAVGDTDYFQRGY